MKSNRITSLVPAAAAAGLMLVMAGCATTVQERVVIKEQPQYVVKHMPAPIHEVISVQPGPGYAWVPGHWAWHQNQWQWQGGHWYMGAVRPMPAVIVEQITIAPSPAHYWVPGHWVWRNGEWEWVKGHWER
jgi:hypothetical protein